MNISHNFLLGIEESPIVKLIVLIEVMKYAFISRHAFEYILREKKKITQELIVMDLLRLVAIKYVAHYQFQIIIRNKSFNTRMNIFLLSTFRVNLFGDKNLVRSRPICFPPR